MLSAQLRRFFRRWLAYERPRLTGEHVRVDVPKDLDWFIYRVLTDKRCSIGWRDLQSMTLVQVLDVHRTLDLRDQLDSIANQQKP
jgi:hypothetical protein